MIEYTAREWELSSELDGDCDSPVMADNSRMANLQGFLFLRCGEGNRRAVSDPQGSFI